jgi:hypothetical protein
MLRWILQGFFETKYTARFLQPMSENSHTKFTGMDFREFICRETVVLDRPNGPAQQ